MAETNTPLYIAPNARVIWASVRKARAHSCEYNFPASCTACQNAAEKPSEAAHYRATEGSKLRYRASNSVAACLIE